MSNSKLPPKNSPTIKHQDESSESIIKSFRTLWIKYTQPLLGLKLIFESEKNSEKNTWIEPNIHTAISDFICENCESNLKIVMQFDTNDIFFNLKLRSDVIYVICYCEKCQEFRIFTSVNLISPPTKSVIISKIEPFIDHPDTELDVPIVIPNSTDCCDNQIEMGRGRLYNYDGSKIGGYKQKIDRQKYTTHQKNLCKCYNENIAKHIFTLMGIDCLPLRNLEIFSLRAAKCDECSFIHFDIYSNLLDIGYDLDIHSFDINDETIFFQIITSEGDKKGVIIETNYYDRYVVICGQINELVKHFNIGNSNSNSYIGNEDSNSNSYIGNENVKYSYKNITMADKNLVKKLGFVVNNTNLNTIKKIIKDDLTYKEIELIKHLLIQEIYGPDFYLTSFVKNIEYSLVKFEDAKLIFQGYFEDLNEDDIRNKEISEFKLKDKCFILDAGFDVIDEESEI